MLDGSTHNKKKEKNMKKYLSVFLALSMLSKVVGADGWPDTILPAVQKVTEAYNAYQFSQSIQDGWLPSGLSRKRGVLKLDMSKGTSDDLLEVMNVDRLLPKREVALKAACVELQQALSEAGLKLDTFYRENPLFVSNQSTTVRRQRSWQQKEEYIWKDPAFTKAISVEVLYGLMTAYGLLQE